MKPLSRRLSLAGLVALALTGCSSLPSGTIPFVGQGAAGPGPATATRTSAYSAREVLAGGLSPRLQRMVGVARARTLQDDFRTELQAGRNSFSTLSIGPFGVQSACQCPLDEKMYAIGGGGFDASLSTGSQNGIDRIFEYNPVTHAVTDIGGTEVGTGERIPAAAIAKQPDTGEIYFIESFNSPRRLFKFNPSTKVRTLIGPTNLTADTVSLTFSRGGDLYTFSDDGKLYTLSQSTGAPTVVPLVGPVGSTSGDIAFYGDDEIIYRVDKDRNFFRFDLATGTATSLGSIAGILSSDVPAGVGFNPSGELLVLTWNNSGTSKIYKVDIEARSATALQSYTTQFPLWDLTSAQRYSCPQSDLGRPDAPTMLFSDSFAGAAANFANLPLETSPDTLSGWRQWNADYYPAGKGVVAWNPGPYNPAPGGIDDPANDRFGKRGTPGEFEAERPHLLETSIARTMPLKYVSGDKVLAKLKVSPTYTHSDSDTTLMICFDDPAQTVAVSSTLRGTKVSGSELYVEVRIPDCATRATVIAMGYLGQQETSSVTFEAASLEFIPKDYYTSSNLLSESFDASGTHASYGTNFPTGMDEQFGLYDFFSVANYPASAGDKALTANRNGAAGSYGGLVKRVNLPAYSASDRLSAKLFAATTFSDAGSEASLLMDFFNSADAKIGTVNAQAVTASQYREIRIDRAAIPSGAAYVKLVPIARFGASEASSFLMNNLSLDIHRLAPAPTVNSLTLNSPAAGSSVNLGSSVALSASPDTILSGMSVEFLDGTTVVATGIKQSSGSYTASWTPATSGSHSLSARVVRNGSVLISSSARSLSVTAPTLSLSAPAAGWSVANKGGSTQLALAATTSFLPSGATVNFLIRRGTTLVATVAAASSGNSHSASWDAKNETAGSYSVSAEILSGTTAIATSSAASGTVN